MHAHALCFVIESCREFSVAKIDHFPYDKNRCTTNTKKWFRKWSLSVVLPARNCFVEEMILHPQLSGGVTHFLKVLTWFCHWSLCKAPPTFKLSPIIYKKCHQSTVSLFTSNTVPFSKPQNFDTGSLTLIMDVETSTFSSGKENNHNLWPCMALFL